ncbi:MAG TPA: ANTAR domain-containing protein [Microlunatus sp.]|nr:ANTAR domain-containing protein [Microlunatus sp.]
MTRISPDSYTLSSDGKDQSVPDEVLVRLIELQRTADNLSAAVGTQRLIGVAIGVLAQRRQCSSDEAWNMLARLSQDTNVKVREVARVLVDGLDGVTRSEDADIVARLRRHLPDGPWS